MFLLDKSTLRTAKPPLSSTYRFSFRALTAMRVNIEKVLGNVYHRWKEIWSEYHGPHITTAYIDISEKERTTNA